MQIDEAREFIKFLHGAVPWNGTWFGEYAPGEKGAYWWRKHLDEAIAALIAAPAAPQQAEPVAWRDHVEQRLHNWRQRTMNRSGDRLALDDMMSKESIDDLIDYVCDEWSDPVAPQQAEPVGYFVNDESDDQWHQVDYEQRNGADTYPLYLHPPAAEVQAGACPHCGSDCNERDELTKAEREITRLRAEVEALEGK